MKHTILLLLRIVVAAAGVGYILFSLTWEDQLVVPAGTSLGATTFERETALPVRSMPADLDGPYTVLLPVPDHGSDGSEDDRLVVSVPAARIGTAATAIRLRPGITTMLGEARTWLLGLGLLLIGPVYGLQAVRWWVLMRARRLGVGVWQAARLYMVGSFFNYCMPGMTGGDVLKAFYAARREDRRADAVMSVAADRMAGMGGMLLFAALCGLTMLNDPLARTVTLWLWAGLLSVAVAGGLYVAPPVRKICAKRFGRIPLPGRGLLIAVDEALFAYRRHPGAVASAIGLSVMAHLMLAAGTAAAGGALGLDAPIGRLLTVLPVLFMAGSVPLTYQGLGVMEGLGMALLLDPPAVTANQIIGMLLMLRLYQIFYSLTGAMFLIRGDVHLRDVRDGAMRSDVSDEREPLSTASIGGDA